MPDRAIPYVAITGGLIALYLVLQLSWWLAGLLAKDRPDVLMALADTLHCGAVGYAGDVDHRLHVCRLYTGHDEHDPMHYCGGREGCGTYWRTPAHVHSQIQTLDEMFAAQAVEPDGRHR